MIGRDLLLVDRNSLLDDKCFEGVKVLGETEGERWGRKIADQVFGNGHNVQVLKTTIFVLETEALVLDFKRSNAERTPLECKKNLSTLSKSIHHKSDDRSPPFVKRRGD